MNCTNGSTTHSLLWSLTREGLIMLIIVALAGTGLIVAFMGFALPLAAAIKGN